MILFVSAQYDRVYMADSLENKPNSGLLGNLVSLADQRASGISNFKGEQTMRSSVSRLDVPKRTSTIKISSTNPATRTLNSQVNFDRRELNEILRIYGFKVAAGEWRDYAIDHLKDRAVFSIFRKASEIALFRIEKTPKLARKQGVYCVVSVSGHVLKRGSDLRQVLRVFEKKPKLEIL